jgi:beta-N-acetylhexosaminidase
MREPPFPSRSPLTTASSRERRRRQRRRQQRRRRAAGLGALLVLIVGVVVAAILVRDAIKGGDEDGGTATVATQEAPAPKPPPAPVDRLSLDQQVGQTVMLRFAGTEVPGYVRRALRRGWANGVILFTDNLVDESQLRQLTSTLLRVGGRSTLISTDQEGGFVRAVPWLAPELGAASISEPSVARSQARAGGVALRESGINVDLAPVADVAAPGTAFTGRAYPGGPQEVARLVAAAVRGFDAGRVGATAKHFPGLGRALANTDEEPVTVDATEDELRADLAPFRAAIRARVPLIMLSHAVYPALDPDRIASQSPRIVRGLLRRELGYDGVVITDSLEAEAVIDRTSVTEAAMRSLDAGADIALTTGQASWRQVFDAVRARARRDRRFRARVRASAARVLALKRRLGLRPPP